MPDRKCGDSGLAYREWHNDAERRHKAGERQRYCARCGRWTWADLAVDGHALITAKEFDRVVRDAKNFVGKHHA